MLRNYAVAACAGGALVFAGFGEATPEKLVAGSLELVGDGDSPGVLLQPDGAGGLSILFPGVETNRPHVDFVWKDGCFHMVLQVGDGASMNVSLQEESIRAILASSEHGASVEFEAEANYAVLGANPVGIGVHGIAPTLCRMGVFDDAGYLMLGAEESDGSGERERRSLIAIGEDRSEGPWQ